MNLLERKKAIRAGHYYQVEIPLSDWTYGKTTKFIKRNTLASDIRRGVRFLSERSYSNVCGSTKSSALFCLALKKHLNFSLVYRVDMKHSNKHWFTVQLYFSNGYVVQLKGFSFGYWGEGSRGSSAILQEIGFTDKQVQRIFNHENQKFIRMFRRL